MAILILLLKCWRNEHDQVYLVAQKPLCILISKIGWEDLPIISDIISLSNYQIKKKRGWHQFLSLSPINQHWFLTKQNKSNSIIDFLWWFFFLANHVSRRSMYDALLIQAQGSIFLFNSSTRTIYLHYCFFSWSCFDNGFQNC